MFEWLEKDLVIIAPWAKPTITQKPSPKNYPHWDVVVKGILDRGFHVMQVGGIGEPVLPGVDFRSPDLELLEYYLRNCVTWLSVDTFLQHFAASLGIPGIVIFGPSDPNIFGHALNINLLKSREYLRKDQYKYWDDEIFKPEWFIEPEKVLEVFDKQVEVKYAKE